MFPVGAVCADRGVVCVASGNEVWVVRKDGDDTHPTTAAAMSMLFQLRSGHVINALAMHWGEQLQRVLCSSGNYVFVASSSSSEGADKEWSPKLVFTAPSRLAALHFAQLPSDAFVCITCTNVAAVVPLSGNQKEDLGSPAAFTARADCGLSYAASILDDFVYCGNYSGDVLGWSWDNRTAPSAGAVTRRICGQHKPGSVIFSLVARQGSTDRGGCTYIATASDDRTVCFSVLGPGEALGSVLWRSDPASARVWAVDARPSCNPSEPPSQQHFLLAAGGEDGTVVHYTLSLAPEAQTTARLVERLESCHRGAGCVAVAWASGDALISCGASGSVLIHDATRSSSATSQRFLPLAKSGGKIRCISVAVVGDGGRPFVGLCTDSSQFVLLDASSGVATNEVPLVGQAASGLKVVRQERVTCMASAVKGTTAHFVIGTSTGSVEVLRFSQLPLASSASGRGRREHRVELADSSPSSVLCLSCVVIGDDDAQLLLASAALTASGKIHATTWKRRDMEITAHRDCSTQCWDGAIGTCVSVAETRRSSSTSRTTLQLAAGAKGGLVKIFDWGETFDVSSSLVLMKFIGINVDRPVQSLLPPLLGDPCTIWKAVASDGSWLDVALTDPPGPPLVAQKLPWQTSTVAFHDGRYLLSLCNCTLSVFQQGGGGGGGEWTDKRWSKIGQRDNIRAPRLFGAGSGTDGVVFAYSPDGALVLVETWLPSSARVLRLGGPSGKDLNAAVGLGGGLGAGCFVTAGEDTSLYAASSQGQVAELHGGHISNILALAAATVGDEVFVVSVGGRSGVALWHSRPLRRSWELLFKESIDDDALTGDCDAVPRFLCVALNVSTSDGVLRATIGRSDGCVCTLCWTLDMYSTDSRSHTVVGCAPIFCLCTFTDSSEAPFCAVGCGNGSVHVLRMPQGERAASGTVAQCSVNTIAAMSLPDHHSIQIACGTDGGEIAISIFSPLENPLLVCRTRVVRVSSTACRGLSMASIHKAIYVSDEAVCVVDLIKGVVEGSCCPSIRGVAHGFCLARDKADLSSVRVVAVGRGAEILHLDLQP